MKQFYTCKTYLLLHLSMNPELEHMVMAYGLKDQCMDQRSTSECLPVLGLSLQHGSCSHAGIMLLHCLSECHTLHSASSLSQHLHCDQDK